jgi:hypothetical protein
MVCLVSMPAAPTSLAFVATTAENMLSTFSLSHKGLTLSRAGEVSHVTRPQVISFQRMLPTYKTWDSCSS